MSVRLKVLLKSRQKTVPKLAPGNLNKTYNSKVWLLNFGVIAIALESSYSLFVALNINTARSNSGTAFV